LTHVQDGKLSMTVTESEAGLLKCSLKTRLARLHLYFERPGNEKCKKSGYNDDSMNQDLEFLYDMLVRPIADNLDKMEHEHQLILVPSEVWY
jgi:hypothetical protein